MKKFTMLIALALCGVQAQAAAVGSRGGKKSLVRSNDANGYPLAISEDKPWKVFESTGAGPVLVLDESGTAPKQGMVHQICISTGATTVWAVASDTNTVNGGATTQFAVGIHLAPPVFAGTTTLLCTPILNAMFTSGLVIENLSAPAGGGSYVYWRELGGYK